MMHVLHVDDEPVILDLTQFFLERTGEMRITTCTSAHEALDRIRTGTFDAVISDYEMPGMNGIELLFELRSTDNPIPFIIFTGRGREEVVIEALNQGADFYIQKGGEAKSQFAELRNAVRRAVEKHRVEEEARASERRIFEIFHHLPDATFAIDCAGTVIAWNRAMEMMSGVAAGEIIGTDGQAYAHPFYGSARPSLVDVLLHPEEEVPPAYTIIQREKDLIIAETEKAEVNGEPVVLWAKATLLYDGDGTVAGAIESVRDITVQKRAEKEVVSAGAYRRTLIEAHIDPLVTIGQDRRISDVNAATETLTGRTRDVLVGAEFCSLFTDPVSADEAYQNVVAAGTVRERPLMVRGADGNVRPVLFFGTLYRGGEGETRGVFAELHDPLPDRTGAAPSDDLIAGILAASVSAGSPDAFLTASLGVVQRLPEIGGGCIVRYGDDGTFPIVREDDPDSFDEILSRLHRPAGAPAAPFADEMRDRQGEPVLLLPLTDGKAVLGLLALSVQVPDLAAYGRRTALEGVAHLIGTLYAQMRRASAGEEMERTAALHLDIVAHDLANTIYAALGYADLLDGTVDGEAGETIEKMTRAIRKGHDIIRNLKTLRRMNEIRDRTAALQETDLDTVIATEIAHFPGIDIEYAGCDAVVLADELVGEIFWNLFDNSIRYGGDEVSIRVDVRETDGLVETRVEDTGPGIPERIRAALASEVHGHGLCIVRDLVVGYGGEIRILDLMPGRPEVGTTVAIALKKADGRRFSAPESAREKAKAPGTGA